MSNYINLIQEDMNPKMSDNIKSIVIEQYLQGKSRDDIARDCGLGAGTVSNIIAAWKVNLTQYVVEDLRELGINLKKSGIGAAQCAYGFKIISMLDRIGVNEDNFQSFISTIYLHCRGIDDLAPHKIASYIEDLLELSKTVPFSQIEQYIEEKKNENTKLEDHKQNLENEIETLQKEESNSKARLDAVLNDEKTTKEEIESFRDLKIELEICGLNIHEDISKFVRLVNRIKDIGFNVEKVISPYQDSVLFEMRQKMLNQQINGMSGAKLRLEQSIAILQNMESFHAQRLSVSDQLESMGFGLNKLRLLRNTIGEIAAENNISSDVAVEEFFKSLEKQYDIKFSSHFRNNKQQRNTVPHRTYNIYDDSSFYSKDNSLPQQKQQQLQQTPPIVIPNIMAAFLSFIYRIDGTEKVGHAG